MRHRTVLLLVVAALVLSMLPAAAVEPATDTDASSEADISSDADASAEEVRPEEPSLAAEDVTAGAGGADGVDRQALADELAAEEGAELYIVQFLSPAVPAYTGGIEGLDATAVEGGEQLETDTPAVDAYRAYLAEEQADGLSAIAGELGREVTAARSYDLAVNGVAVELEPAEAAALALLPEVAFIERQQIHQLETDAGPEHMNADYIWDGEYAGAPEGGTSGAGVVIGVLDSGVTPENPSFSDDPEDYDDDHVYEWDGAYFGACDPENDDYDPDFPCNDKLIGAWGLTPANDPYDSDDHGTHTASTAGGNRLADVTLGPDDDPLEIDISGVAPNAHLLTYRVCDAGCPLDAIIAGVDQAVEDGVDVINYSIGGQVPSTNLWGAAENVAWLNANGAGIYVSHSAGNAGPADLTLARSSDLPWVTSVGASEHTRAIENSLTDISGDDDAALDDIVGRGFTGALEAGTEVVYDGDDPYCYAPDEEVVTGAIVLCDRGGPTPIGRVQGSENVAAAGGVGFVLMNTEPQAQTRHADEFAVPGVHISFTDGEALKAFYADNDEVTAGVSGYTYEPLDNPQVDWQTSFSSRGPNQAAQTLKPNITAPGLDIIAAINNDEDGGPQWGVISGTSMSSPHVAGAYGLIAAARPDWSAAEAQSALQLTARPDTPKEDGTDGDPHSEGSGYADLSGAPDAGFVLDITQAEYEAANPDEGGDVRDLNYPELVDFEVASSATWTRTLTSTQDDDVTYEVDFAGEDLTLTTEPEGPLTIPAGEDVDVTFTATLDEDAAVGDLLFGRVTMTPDDAEVPEAHMPVVVEVAAPVSDLDVDPDALSVVLPEDDGVAEELTVSNTGNVPVSWALTDEGVGPIWHQPTEGTSGIVSDRFLDDEDDSGVFTAEDFTVGAEADIQTIHTPGFWAPQFPRSLADAELITWAIYADDGGAPAGHPDDGEDSEVWSFSAATDAAGVSIEDDDITLDIGASNADAIDLEAGTYWLSVHPDIPRNTDAPDGLNDRWNWYQGAPTGAEAHLIDPDGLFGDPMEDWDPLSELVDFDALAMTLSGTFACDLPEDVTWLTVEPVAGDLDGGESEGVVVAFDSSGLERGTYTATLCFGDADDPTVPVITVPVEMEVTAFASIAGTVTAAEDDAPIEGATVAIPELDLETTTDADGEYTIDDVQVGEREVTAVAPGYTELSQDVDVPDEGLTDVDFVLELLPPAVGIAGDFNGQLGAFLDENSIDNVPFEWGDDLTRFTAIIVNRGADPGEEVFLDFIDATDAEGTGVVLLDTDSTLGGSGIQLANIHLDNPAVRDSGWATAIEVLAYEVTENHPIVGSSQPGTVIPFDTTTGFSDHAWFDQYTGEGVTLIADTLVDGEVVGRGVAVEDRDANHHVLLSMHGTSTFTGPGNWEPASALLFLRAVQYAEEGEVDPPTGPVLEVDPDAISATVISGEATAETLTIANTGDDTLSWAIVTAEGDDCATADVPWLSADPASGSTPLGSSSDVTVTLDAADLEAGEYDAVLCVTSEDEGVNDVSVPVDLTVEPAGSAITIEPTELEIDVPEGSTASEAITIGNDGDVDLEWSITTAEPATAAIDGEATVVPSGAAEGAGVEGFALEPSTEGEAGEVLASSDGPSVAQDEIVLTHSESQDIVALNSIACGALGSTSDNAYLRTFTLADFDVTEDFEVIEVEFGVENVSAPKDVVVTIYALDDGAELTYANLEELGSAEETLEVQEGTYVSIPVDATVPAGMTLVAEVFSPDSPGGFYIGSNDEGQTAPSYLAAPACGADEPTDIEDLGFPEMHIVMNVTGELAVTDCDTPVDLPWLSADPDAGTVEPGGTDEAAITVDASDLSEGDTLDAILCVASNAGATVQVPVSVSVTEPDEEPDPELVSVEVSPAEVSVEVGGTVELTATATYDDDSTADVTGEAAWTSSDEAVATVDAGTVSGVAEGETEVSASFEGESDSASVTVTDGEPPVDPELVELVVLPSSATVGVGGSVELVATAIYDDQSTVTVTGDAEWVSDDESVATVDAGLVTGAAEGVAEITATFEGESATATITVDADADPDPDPDLVSLEVTPAESTLAVGDIVELTATATYTDDSTVDVTDDAAWESSHAEVAEIEVGTVTAVADGVAVISATFAGRTATATVVVGDEVEPGPEGLVRISAPPGRVEVAIAASQDRFDDGEADAVVLARADEYPDALAGTPLAADRDAPLLITSSNELLGNVAEEIVRVLGDDGDVYLLGGTVALDDEVEAAIADLGYGTTRLAGETRFETAQVIAGALDDVGSVLLTTGLDFPDALTAGAAASANDGVVLLTAGDDGHPTIDAYLDGFDGDVWAIGGPATRAYPGAEGVLGATRDETAVAVAEAFFDEPSTFGVARRDDFPDALAGGAHIAAYGGPLLLSYTGEVPEETAAWVSGTPVTGGFVYGGTAAVSEEVFDQLEDLAFDDDDQ